MKPQVPIEVDERSGVWTTDGLPMLYVPRHFFVNNHTAIEASLGREKYAELLYDAGYKSAHYWCGRESQTHGLAGVAVFEHYLERLSQRGWGKFCFVNVDAKTAHADIRLDHSAFVLASPGERGRLCYMFAGWFSGAMDWVLEQSARQLRTISSETQCASEGHPHCIFSVRPQTTPHC
jgi:predicted hydrocarbon binding protein